jgi:hypothetical protein
LLPQLPPEEVVVVALAVVVVTLAVVVEAVEVRDVVVEVVLVFAVVVVVAVADPQLGTLAGQSQEAVTALNLSPEGQFMTNSVPPAPHCTNVEHVGSAGFGTGGPPEVLLHTPVSK